VCFFRCLLSSYHLSLTFSVLAEELPEANPTPEELTEDADAEELTDYADAEELTEDADAEELLVDSDSATDYEVKVKQWKLMVF
jgi:hypothetical protein